MVVPENAPVGPYCASGAALIDAKWLRASILGLPWREPADESFIFSLDSFCSGKTGEELIAFSVPEGLA